MLAYQRECDRRVRVEVEAEVARVRDTELARLKAEESARCREEIAQSRERLEKVGLSSQLCQCGLGWGECDVIIIIFCVCLVTLFVYSRTPVGLPSSGRTNAS